MVTKSRKRGEGRRLSPQRPQYTNLYRCLKRKMGCSLRASLYKRSMVRLGYKATHKCSRVEGSFSRCQNHNSVGCYRQLHSINFHKQTGKNPLSGNVCSPVVNHDLVPSLPGPVFTKILRIFLRITQALDPSLQTSPPRKKNKGGGGHTCCKQVFRSRYI